MGHFPTHTGFPLGHSQQDTENVVILFTSEKPALIRIPKQLLSHFSAEV